MCYTQCNAIQCVMCYAAVLCKDFQWVMRDVLSAVCYVKLIVSCLCMKTFTRLPINQGFLSAGLIGGLFGSELPGQGTVYLSQTMKFYKPIYVGDEVTAEIEIIDIEPSKPIITFRTVCKNNKGEIAIDGEALVTLMK